MLTGLKGTIWSEAILDLAALLFYLSTFDAIVFIDTSQEQ